MKWAICEHPEADGMGRPDSATQCFRVRILSATRDLTQLGRVAVSQCQWACPSVAHSRFADTDAHLRPLVKREASVSVAGIGWAT